MQPMMLSGVSDKRFSGAVMEIMEELDVAAFVCLSPQAPVSAF